jgi:hypothetical protein
MKPRKANHLIGEKRNATARINPPKNGNPDMCFLLFWL